VRTWGVLSLAGPDAARLAQHRLALSGLFDGVVEVSAEGRGTSLTPVRFRGLLGQLVAGLSSVPHDVERIAFLDERALDSLGIEPVLEMISWLDDRHAAVVRAAPVTDALKRVDGRSVVGGVDRSSLYVPQPPHIIRRDALDRALISSGDLQRVTDDPAGLLVAAGHAIRVVRDAGPPVTLSAGR